MWPNNTRFKNIRLSALTETSSNPRVWDIPKTAILSGLTLNITGSLTGTLTSPNALGKASIIRRVRLIANSGIALIDVSGAGYHYLLRNQLETGIDVLNSSDAKSAVASGAYDLSMFFPIAVNSRDALGLFMLQNNDTALRLEVEFESNAAIATGISAHTNTVQPVLDLFTVPVDPKDWPDFKYIHTMTEEALSVPAAGEVSWYWPRGNSYLTLFHGLGIGASGSDLWTQYRMRVNQSDYIFDWDVATANRMFQRYRGYSRVSGVVPVDLMFTSGLGNYGSARDAFDSSRVTDVASVIQASAAGTLYTMKRQLVSLE